nr:hypothetical protein [Burkholderia pseudomallei]
MKKRIHRIAAAGILGAGVLSLSAAHAQLGDFLKQGADAGIGALLEKIAELRMRGRKRQHTGTQDACGGNAMNTLFHELSPGQARLSGR